MYKIDLNQWPRKEIFEFMHSISNPFYMVSFNVDVTHLYDYVKRNNLSFYYSMCWCVTKAINQVDAFHYAMFENEIYYIDQRNPSFTDLKPDSDLFYIVTVKMDDDIAFFCQQAAQKSKNQKNFIDLTEETHDLIYLSCLPWIDMTSCTNEFNTSDPHFKDDSIPRIAWGKYKQQGESKTLNLSIELNHCFADGYHIGQFSLDLQHIIDQL